MADYPRRTVMAESAKTFIGMKKYLERKALRYRARIFWANTDLDDVTEVFVDADGDIYVKSFESGRWTVWVGKCEPLPLRGRP